MTETTKMNKSARVKWELLTSKYSRYSKFYSEWKDLYNDDRRLYQNIYEGLLKSLKIMGRIGNSTIWVGYNYEFDKDLKVLDRIITTFTELKVA